MPIETDSPYMASVPYRGKTNSSTDVPHVAARLAKLRGTTADHIAATTSQHFNQLFASDVPILGNLGHGWGEEINVLGTSRAKARRTNERTNERTQ